MITEIYLYLSLFTLTFLVIYNLNNISNYLSIKHKIMWIFTLSLPFFLSIKICLQNSEIIYRLNIVTFYVNKKLSLLVLLIMLSMLLVLFTAKNKKLIKVFFPIVLNSLLIVLIIVTNQMVINFFMLIIITLINYYLFDKKIISIQGESYVITSFYWQIVSDLVIFFGLFYHLAQNNLALFTAVYQEYQLTYFLSTMFIILGIIAKIILLESSSKYYNIYIYKMISLTAALVVFYKYFSKINDVLILKNIRGLFVVLVLYYFIKTVKNKNNTCFFVFSLATFLISINRFYEPFFIIVFSSLFIFLFMNEEKIILQQEKSKKNTVNLAIERIFLKIISPFYGNFLFFIFPQLCFSLFQLPLKLLHNGSSRRSLIMILVIFITYFYISVR